VGGLITVWRWEETFSFLLNPVGGTLFGFCPSGAKLTRKSVSFTVQGGTTRVTVRLVS
jgi:hypothetical protein